MKMPTKKYLVSTGGIVGENPTKKHKVNLNIPEMLFTGISKKNIKTVFKNMSCKAYRTDNAKINLVQTVCYVLY